MSDTNEAPASMNFRLTYKGVDVQITNRDIAVKVLPYLKKAKTVIDWALTDGGYTVPVQRSFGAKKEVEYVKDASGNPFPCPTCKVGKVKVIHSKDGKTYYGCDQSKYNPLTKTSEGCRFFQNTDPSKSEPEVRDSDIPDNF